MVEAHRWTRKEYECLAAQGFLSPGKHFELIEGVIYDKPPQDSLNATAIHELMKLFGAFSPTGRLRDSRSASTRPGRRFRARARARSYSLDGLFP